MPKQLTATTRYFHNMARLLKVKSRHHLFHIANRMRNAFIHKFQVKQRQTFQIPSPTSLPLYSLQGGPTAVRSKRLFVNRFTLIISGVAIFSTVLWVAVM